jgi:hypothetical protein
MWLESMQCKDNIMVEWLPLSLFSPYSRFALLFRDIICLDVVIHGDEMRVTQTMDGFKAVGFGSDWEFECYLKLEFRRALTND